MVSGIPSELKSLFCLLHIDLVRILVRWDMYIKLYVDNTHRARLLSTVDKNFFSTISSVLSDDVVTGIGRMTDATTTGKYNNLVIRRLVDKSKSSGYDDLATDLMNKLEVINTVCRPIRLIRDKHLAHRDLEMAQLPKLTLSTDVIQNTLDGIMDFMNTFCRYFNKSHTIAYCGVITDFGSGSHFIKSLRRIVEHRRLESEDMVPEVGYLSNEFRDA